MRTTFFSGNIEKQTLNNNNYRKVIFTSPNGTSQLVLMSLKPKEAIGLEKHDKVDQFIRIEEGSGDAFIGPEKNNLTHVKLESGSGLLIPANNWHNIINSDANNYMKLYTIYTPKEHEDLLVQHTKPTEQDGGDDNFYYKYIKYKQKYHDCKMK